MAYEKEMTALNPSVAADEEQSNNDYGNSITDYDEKSNSFEANNENDFDYQNLDFDEEYVLPPSHSVIQKALYNVTQARVMSGKRHSKMSRKQKLPGKQKR